MTAKSTIGQTVHILPLGFEVERALVPFTDYVPNRVILVIQGSDGTEHGEEFYAEQMQYATKVQTSLESRGVRVEVLETDTFTLNLFIRDLSQLIRKEKEAGNTVSINVSSSGRFASIAAAIAGMAQDIEVYYVPAVGYARSEDERREFGVSRCSGSEVWKFDNYRFVLPKEEEALVLEYLYLSREKLHRADVSLKDIGRILHAAFPDRYPWIPLDEQPKKYYKQQPKTGGYDQYRQDQSAFTIRFKTALASDMTANQYVERIGSERKRVFYRITPTGEYALFLYGISGRIVERRGKLVFDKTQSDTGK